MALDLSKPLCTRDGRVAILNNKGLITSIAEASGDVISADIPSPSNPNVTQVYRYNREGIWRYDGEPSRHDLINEMPWHAWLRYAVHPVGTNKVGVIRIKDDNKPNS